MAGSAKRRRDSLTMEDLQLLHEALSYARKRTWQPAEQIRLQGVLDRVEAMLLRSPEAQTSLRLSPPEQEVLEAQVQRYCEAMTQRGASPRGRHEVKRLEHLLGLLGARRAPWWQRWFGRS